MPTRLESVTQMGLESVTQMGLESVTQMGLESVTQMGLESGLLPIELCIHSQNLQYS
jgi:hypothetical protein